MTLDGEIERIRMMDRHTVLDYNIQHEKFENIILKNWFILKQDRVLGPVLPIRIRSCRSAQTAG